jgi:nucleotide-binding universal stress UspA family protein
MKSEQKGGNMMTLNDGPILCGTDFSKTALEAVYFAAAMARHLGTKLLLVHVLPDSGLAPLGSESFGEIAARSRVALGHEGDRVRNLGTDVELKLLSGSIFDELVNAAVAASARLVVVGAVGHGLPRRLMLGSVAERTAEASPVPTLVIRPGGRLSSWLLGEHPLKILTGYDFSAAGDAALEWIAELRKVGNCETTVVHIDWPPAEARRLDYRGALPLTENPEEIQKVLERDLADRVGRILPLDEIRMLVIPGWGETEGYLFEIAVRRHADLVVVGTHQRLGLDQWRLGSVSRSVLHHATVAVAVVPPAQDSSAAPPIETNVAHEVA